MPSRPTPLRPLLSALLCVCPALFVAGCGKKEIPDNEPEEKKEKSVFSVPPQSREALRLNRLSKEPTGLLRSRATDPVHWQPWSPELFNNATAEQKPIMALIISGEVQGVGALLDDLMTHENLVSYLNENFACTLIDIHAHPEMGLLAYHFSNELRRPISFPMMLWLTHEGYMVSSLPIARYEQEVFPNILENASETVTRIWRDNPHYFVNNSVRDNAQRIERLREMYLTPAEKQIGGPQLGATLQKAGRELSALYDPISKSIDHSGGLIPLSLLQFSDTVSNYPATTGSVKRRLDEMSLNTIDVLLKSAMFDPLDGGVFKSRRGPNWALPSFVKDTRTQLEVIIALSRNVSQGGDRNHLRAAQRVLSYIDGQLLLGGQAVVLTESSPSSPEEIKSYLWSRAQLRELLTDDEFRIAEKCYAVTGYGNIPIESDPKRLYFQLNSLGQAMTSAEAADALGLTEEQASQLLESARKKLLAKRQDLLEGGLASGSVRTSDANARFSRALVELARASDSSEPLVRAGSLLSYLREQHYSPEKGLMHIPPADGRRGVPARGRDYAVLLDALFALYRHDLDPALLSWADQLAREAVEKLADEGHLLREVPVDDRIFPLPLHHVSMVFGISTWGTMTGPLKRLHQLSEAEVFEQVLTKSWNRLEPSMDKFPLVHTDFAESALVEIVDSIAVLEGDKTAPAFQALHGVLRETRYDPVTVVHLAPGLPEGLKLPDAAGRIRAVIRKGQEELGEAATPEELRVLLDRALASD